MTSAKKFLALYLTPASVLEDWMKTDTATRKSAEDKMRSDWNNWMGSHTKMVVSTESAGKTKRVTSNGVADTRNEVMLVSIVEADSQEAAAKAFENHPHLQIPQSSIEVMEIKQMSAM